LAGYPRLGTLIFKHLGMMRTKRSRLSGLQGGLFEMMAIYEFELSLCEDFIGMIENRIGANNH
jgi:hypothetical protein